MLTKPGHLIGHCLNVRNEKGLGYTDIWKWCGLSLKQAKDPVLYLINSPFFSFSLQ